MEHDPMQPLSASQKEALREAVETYEQAVLDHAEVRGYVEDRGITATTADTFRLGVVADPLPGHEMYRGMLAIPYLGADSEPLSIKFRCIKDHSHKEFGHGKYMGIPHNPARTFNVRAIHEAGNEIHLTEGELDAVILNQIGLPAIGIPGSDGFRSHHRRMLAGFSKVWVWGDPDEAGARFVTNVMQRVRQAKGVRIRGGDVTEVFLEEGEAALHELVSTK